MHAAIATIVNKPSSNREIARVICLKFYVTYTYLNRFFCILVIYFTVHHTAYSLITMDASIITIVFTQLPNGMIFNSWLQMLTTYLLHPKYRELVMSL